MTYICAETFYDKKNNNSKYSYSMYYVLAFKSLTSIYLDVCRSFSTVQEKETMTRDFWRHPPDSYWWHSDLKPKAQLLKAQGSFALNAR